MNEVFALENRTVETREFGLPGDSWPPFFRTTDFPKGPLEGQLSPFQEGVDVLGMSTDESTRLMSECFGVTSASGLLIGPRLLTEEYALEMASQQANVVAERLCKEPTGSTVAQVRHISDGFVKYFKGLRRPRYIRLEMSSIPQEVVDSVWDRAQVYSSLIPVDVPTAPAPSEGDLWAPPAYAPAAALPTYAPADEQKMWVPGKGDVPTVPSRMYKTYIFAEIPRVPVKRPSGRE